MPLNSSPIVTIFDVAAMLDFSSSLYLGFRHSADSLPFWKQLTTGKPAALYTSRRQLRIETGLSDLTGTESAVLGQSSFHLFWDLFQMLAKNRIAIYLDRAAYPVSSQAAQPLVARGIPIHVFSHFRPAVLKRQLENASSANTQPVVVVDGYCPGCGRFAPVRELSALLKPYSGMLLIDDTQALGIFGEKPHEHSMYGIGGGGSLRCLGIDNPNIVLISSLAKGFGVPAAMLGGNASMVEQFKTHSQTRLYMSPPSCLEVLAIEHALRLNQSVGDKIRAQLAMLVQLFRNLLAAGHLQLSGGTFAIQSLTGFPASFLHAMFQHLRNKGILCLLHRQRCRKHLSLSFVISAAHTTAQIRQTANTVRLLNLQLNPQFRKGDTYGHFQF